MKEKNVEFHTLEMDYIEKASYIVVNLLLVILMLLSVVQRSIPFALTALVLLVTLNTLMYRFFEGYFYVYHNSILKQSEEGLILNNYYWGFVGTVIDSSTLISRVDSYKIGWRWIKVKGDFKVYKKVNYTMFISPREIFRTKSVIKIPIMLENQKLTQTDIMLLLDDEKQSKKEVFLCEENRQCKKRVPSKRARAIVRRRD